MPTILRPTLAAATLFAAVCAGGTDVPRPAMAAHPLRRGPIAGPASAPATPPSVVAVAETPAGKRVAAITDRIAPLVRQLASFPPDVLVVLGARVRGGKPGRHMIQRLDTTLRLFHAMSGRPRVLLTGAAGEADAMHDYLLARGVPEERILLERNARDTVQNARFSVAILERHWRTYTRALLVTTAVPHRRAGLDDHARRALLQFARFTRRVAVSSLSVNDDPAIAPRYYPAPAEAAASAQAHRQAVHARRTRSRVHRCSAVSQLTAPSSGQ